MTWNFVIDDATVRRPLFDALRVRLPHVHAHCFDASPLPGAQLAAPNGKLWDLCEGDATKLSIELLVAAAQQGDRLSLNLLAEAGAHLGAGIVGLINLLDPQLIVIGGAWAAIAAEFLEEPIRRLVRERALGVDLPDIRFSNLTEVDWTRDAGFLVAEHVLEERYLEFLRSRRSVLSPAVSECD